MPSKNQRSVRSQIWPGTGFGGSEVRLSITRPPAAFSCPVKLFVPAPSSGTFEDNRLSGTVPELNWEAFRAVRLAPLPLKVAVIVLAARFPRLSRLTRLLGEAVLEALLAALTPEAMLLAETPPTLKTTVADWGPTTSPTSEPVKLVAVEAVVAVLALVAVTAVAAVAALVAVEALPFKEAVIMPAEKLPDESRLTMAPAALALDAPLAAVAPEATVAAGMPAMELTTVETWLPPTSPERNPVKSATDWGIGMFGPI